MSDTTQKQAVQAKKYMRAKEVAKYLGIGASTVWLYAKQGKLTPKKISPRVTVFTIDEIDSILKEVA
jgi:predicted DNA-binding transcriptional regulator AlpA